MISNLNIRVAQKYEAPQIASLIIDNATATLLPHYTPEQWRAFCSYYTLDAVQSQLDHLVYHCALLQDEIVGTIGLDGSWVIGFYTKKEFLGQGIGKTLMDYIISEGRRRQLDLLHLAASPVGVGFYRKIGWVEEETKMFTYCGVEFEETKMCLQI